ncbi:PH domain-containing protein [Streptomyces chitinivorans]|uniref:PH domain-containing protein n=1 Tax=Streptomyces chitinivorans TaxID=1257027 RepID=A0ABW7HPU7_9ACTN|nr:PH domain-containing protein [Streptomyces chitinivorans]MDH2407603.1 PH domain-containing protein [Streptomyces chitinivorans]
MSEQTGYADHTYRSTMGMVGGTLLMALVVLLAADGIVSGEGRTRWLSLAALVALVPLIFAFSLRPAVYAGRERLRVRNPFRTITLPWASVEGVRAAYSAEVFAGDGKYQMWAIPVSLRQRKKALRQDRGGGNSSVNLSGHGSVFAPGLSGGSGYRPQADQAIDEIRALAERHASDEGAQGAPSVRWAYEVLVPAVAGGAALLLLLFLG